MPRRQDQAQIRIAVPQADVRVDDDPLLASVGAASDPHRCRTEAQVTDAEAILRQVGIELDAAGHLHRGRAQCPETLSRVVVLADHGAQVSEHLPDGRADTLVAMERALGQPGVNKENVHTSQRGLPYDVRPEFRFE